MDSVTVVRERLQRAVGLPDVLDAAYRAFLTMLPVIMIQQDRAGPDYVAYVMAGGSAGHGRFAVFGAPSLPSSARALSFTAASEAALTPADAAAAITGLADLLVRQLTGIMPTVRSGADRLACTEAVRHARAICDLLGGAVPR